MRCVTRFIGWLLLLVSAQFPVTGLMADHADEYLIKAAMVRNFARFIQWPEAGQYPGSRDVLTLCVMGDARVENGFAHVAGKKVSGRILALTRVNRAAAINRCDILFVGRSATTNLNRIMGAADGPVLTIGETEQFLRAGGMITFFEKQGRIRFQINLQATRAAGFTVSSSLLELAELVDPATGSGVRR